MATRKGRNINAELGEKLGLKRKGHSLIDQIKWKGYSKDEVYHFLAREMGIDDEQAHFARMQSMRTLKAAVEALQCILDKVPETQYAAGKKRPQSAVARVIKTEPKKEPVILTPSKPVKVKVNKRTKDVLPRDQMLRALAEMKEQKEKGYIITQVRGESPVVQTYDKPLLPPTQWQKLQSLFQKSLSSIKKNFGPAMVSIGQQSLVMKGSGESIGMWSPSTLEPETSSSGTVASPAINGLKT